MGIYRTRLAGSVGMIVTVVASACGGAMNTLANEPALEPDTADGLAEVDHDDGGVTWLRERTISAGVLHTCVITSSGELKCWGANHSGQIGGGTLLRISEPYSVPGLGAAVRSVAAGEYHTCALTRDRAVLCWGDNEFGQLGDGTKEKRNAPTAVRSLFAGVVSIAAGNAHTCAVTADGTPMCWGVYDFDGNEAAFRLSPEEFYTSTPVKAISAGFNHTCALTTFSLKCWGFSDVVEMLSPYRISRTTSYPVPGYEKGSMKAVSCGYFNCCVITKAGEVGCFGENLPGKSQRVRQITRIDGVRDVVDVAIGKAHTCALTSQGGVKCWGYNHNGCVGDGTREDRWTPAQVVGLTSGVKAIAAGEAHTCAHMSNGAVKCWGVDRHGQQGGLHIDAVPVDIEGIR